MALGCGVLLAACASEEPPPPPQEVVVSPARQSFFPIYGNYVAVTRPSQDVEVRARVDGFVEAIEYQEGSYVSEGDPLYRIDNRPYAAKIDRLEANLSSATAQLKKSERDVERLQPLYAENAASQLDLDTAIAAMEQARASVAAIEAELAEAQLDLEFTHVTAPIDGLVGARNVDIGGLVGSAGKSLLTTVKRVDPMYVEFRMTALDYLNAQRRRRSYQEQVAAEEEGRAVEGWVSITLPDDSTYGYRGDIAFTEPEVNPETGTFAVRAVVPNPNRQLLPGQYTRARLELDAIPNAVFIDEKTIRVEQGGSYVMVVLPDDTVEQRFIVLGPQNDNEVVVRSGLSKGERVIVEGMHRVQHGQSVVPLTEEEYAKRKEARQKEPGPGDAGEP
ncbi:MAG: efflux RND transporter periplasmic adaptor subunit [Pseudomonadota bacterium]